MRTSRMEHKLTASTPIINPAARDSLDPYLPLRELVAYSGLSLRSLRRALADRRHPLPHYRLGTKKILIRRSEFDRWMRQFKEAPASLDLDRMIEETLRELHP